jgi:hypothetical protein
VDVLVDALVDVLVGVLVDAVVDGLVDAPRRHGVLTGTAHRVGGDWCNSHGQHHHHQDQHPQQHHYAPLHVLDLS